MNLLPRKSPRDGAVAFSKLIHLSADETDSKGGSGRSTSSYGPHQWNHEYIHVINERRRGESGGSDSDFRRSELESWLQNEV